MTNTTAPHEPGTYINRTSAPSVIPLVSRALRRIGEAIFDSHRRRTERELAQYIEWSGGRLTDDVERRMMRHLSASNLSLRDE